jgi:hypothetical protein
LGTYGANQAASGGDFDLTQFLLWLATSSGAGLAVFATIEYAEKLLHKAFSPNFKFYSAIVLSYVYPVGAYLATVGAGWQEWSVGLLAASVAVGYQVSQTIHYETPSPAPEAAVPAEKAKPAS